MNELNEFSTITTPMLERHLAIKQLVHYLYLQQSAIAVGNHDEHRRATVHLDRLTTEYGLDALNQANAECNE